MKSEKRKMKSAGTVRFGYFDLQALNHLRHFDCLLQILVRSLSAAQLSNRPLNDEGRIAWLQSFRLRSMTGKSTS